MTRSRPPAQVRSKRVVVVGGGYAGTALARELDPHVEVTLIDRQDVFFHRVAALRAAVDERWTTAPFIGYDRLLSRGRFVHGEVVGIDPVRQTVTLNSGEEIEYDAIVLATGTEARAPAQFAGSTAARAAEEMRAHQRRIAAASSIVIVGGGPVGVELAGEIVAVHPGKSVDLVEAGPSLLSAENNRALSERAQKLLEARGVKVHLRQGYRPDDFPEADLTLWAVGSRPNTDWLPGAQLTDRGLIRVDEHLRVHNWPNAFAIGDVTDVPEIKKVLPAVAQAKVAAANVRAVLAGHAPRRTYKPSTSKLLVVPVGPDDGVSLLPVCPNGAVVGGTVTKKLKGADLFVGRYRAAVGQPNR